jgi:hypothetical protein
MEATLMKAAAESAAKEGSTEARPESRSHPQMTESRTKCSTDHSRPAEASAESTTAPEPAGKSSAVLSESTRCQQQNRDQNSHNYLIEAYPPRRSDAITVH